MFNREELRNKVGTEPFLVVFTKKDGTLREMVAQVNCGQFGYKTTSTAEINPDILVVYDMEFYSKLHLTPETSNKACRSVNVSTIQQILFEDNVIYEAA